MYLETQHPYTSAEIGIEYPAFEQVGQPDEQEPSGIQIARRLHRVITEINIKTTSLICTGGDLDKHMTIQRELMNLIRELETGIWKLNGASWNDGFQVGLQRPDGDLPF